MPHPISVIEGQLGALLNWQELNAFLTSYEGTSPASFLAATSHVRVVAASDAPTYWKLLAGTGFVCDNTNDQSELQAAANELAVKGGKVVLSPGTFTCAAAITPDSKVYFVGQGGNTSRILASTTLPFGLMIWSGTSVTQKRWWGLQDLKLDGGGTATPLLFLQWANTGWIDQVWFISTSNAGIAGFAWWDSTVSRCRFDGCGSKAAANNTAAIAAIHCDSTGVTDNTNNIQIYACWFENTSSVKGDQYLRFVSGVSANEQNGKIRVFLCKFEIHTVGNCPINYFQQLNQSNFIDNITVIGDFNTSIGAPVAQRVWHFKSCSGIKVDGLGIEAQVVATIDTVASFVCLEDCNAVTLRNWWPSDQPSNFPQTAVLEYIGTNTLITVDDGDWNYNGNSVANGGTGTIWRSGAPSTTGGRRKLVRRTADGAAIVSNVTLANDAVLLVDVQAGRSGTLDMLVIYSSSVAAGLKIALTLPTGATFAGSIVGPGQAAGTFWDGTSIALTGAGVAVKNTIRIIGEVTVASAQTGTGNVRLQAAQNASDATNTVIRAGSRMEFTAG